MKKLQQTIKEYVQGCFTGIWIKTQEPTDAIDDITQLCRQEEWQVAVWNIDQGFGSDPSATDTAVDSRDPLSAARFGSNIESIGSPSVLILENYHRFLGSPEIVQAVAARLHAGKQTCSVMIVIAPLVDLPPELEKLFVVVEHALPDREQLHSIASSIATEEGELPTGDDLKQVIDASSGLTRCEAESAFSLSLVRHGRIQANTIWELKTQALEKSGLLKIYRGDACFEDLGGLDSLKSFCRRAIHGSSQSVRARGILLLSPPGCGKTQICKALGNEVGRPVVMLDVGALMGSLVGQTEERTRQALKVIDAIEPAVVLLDEVEKSLAGVSGSGDSGVSSRMFGTMLSWLNDRESDTFVVCTANDVSRLPPEFARAERFDAIYFVDLPSAKEKKAIWSIYTTQFEIDSTQPKPRDQNWTGAEIKACCRLSVLLGVSLVEAAKHLVPVSKTAAEAIEKLRTWATDRCLDASSGGPYRFRKSNRSRDLRTAGPAPSMN